MFLNALVELIDLFFLHICERLGLLFARLLVARVEVHGRRLEQTISQALHLAHEAEAKVHRYNLATSIR